ncbi:hypothetical protein KBD59_00625 [Candidatus Gracilibacteria bacterium]|nr:hypothetical protein [Candidatus Gracilibacteria bacterium]
MKKLSLVSLAVVSILVLSACGTPPQDYVTPPPGSITEFVPAQFPTDYNHSFNIKYPSQDTFETGGDTDSYSASWIKDKNGKVIVTILDNTLIGCPASKPGCGIDEAVVMTPAQIYEQGRKNYDNDKGFVATEPVTALAKELVNVNVYTGVSEDTKEEVLIYLINTGTGVVQVTFAEPKKLGEAFIADIVRSITPNAKSTK